MSKLIIFLAIKNQKSGSDSANSHLNFDFLNILLSIFQISFLFSLLFLNKNKVLNSLELLMLLAKLIIGTIKHSIDFQKEDVLSSAVLLSSRFEANFK